MMLALTLEISLWSWGWPLVVTLAAFFGLAFWMGGEKVSGMYAMPMRWVFALPAFIFIAMSAWLIWALLK